MARKYIRGYGIEDIKVGMKIREKEDKDGSYEIIKNIDDIHNVEAVVYDKDNKRIGFAFYCFDKTCAYEYFGAKIEIIKDDNGELQK